MSTIKRVSKETDIRLSVRVGSHIEVATSEPFLDHMLVTLARYAGLELEVEATGDLPHHLIEDVGISLGLALRDEVPSSAARYGWATVPMDEALVECALDLGGRSWYEGELPSGLYEHFIQSLAVNLGATVHIRVIRGRDKHHIIEAAFKALGLAVRQALLSGPDAGVFSTKGSVSIERSD